MPILLFRKNVTATTMFEIENRILIKVMSSMSFINRVTIFNLRN